MKDGFMRVAAATPDIKVADCDYNADRIIELTKQAAAEDVSVIVFPELCITGYTCRDLFPLRWRASCTTAPPRSTTVI